MTNANKTVEGELTRFEKILAVFEKFLETRYGELNDKLEQLSHNKGRFSDGDQNLTVLATNQEEYQAKLNLISNNTSRLEEDNRNRYTSI